jgi:hypothetical protein
MMLLKGVLWFAVDQGLKKPEKWPKGLIEEALSIGVLE